MALAWEVMGLDLAWEERVVAVGQMLWVVAMASGMGLAWEDRGAAVEQMLWFVVMASGMDLAWEDRGAAVGQIRLLGSVRVPDLVFEERVAVF